MHHSTERVNKHRISFGCIAFLPGVKVKKDLMIFFLTCRPVRLVRGAEQIMGILCTSGTTGLPKATTLSNAQLVLLMT